MSHDHETPADSDASAVTEPLSAPGEPEPAFLARARRILGGDIRPDDYLTVTPEVRAAADFELAYVRSHMKIEPLPEVIANQLRNRMMSFHHGGENILYVEDDKGVAVVAVGEEQIGLLFRTLPAELLNGITDGCPEPF